MKSFFLGLIFPISLIQYANAEETTALEEYTVTARPIGLQSIEHIAQPITVLTGKQLNKKQASTLGETLENIPGVTSNRFSPLASRPVIRGLSGTRVQVLENGVGSMDVSTISVDHAVTIDPLQAEQVEIFRGPSTLLYGSEASGGLVNVVTNRIPEYVPDSFNPKLYSSYNTNSLEKIFSFQAEGGYEKVAFHIDALNRDARSYESKDGQVDNSFYDVTNFNLGTSYIDDWGFLGMSYGRFNSTHGVPINPNDPDELPFIDSIQDRIDLSGKIYNPFSGIKAINVQGAYNEYNHTEFEDAATPGTVFSNEQFEGRIEIQHAPIGVFNGVIGTQFGYRDVSAVGDEAFLPKTKTNNFAIFILEDTDINDTLHFEIGGRYEYQDSDPDNADSVSKDLYSVSSGIHWHFTDNIALGFNLGRSQRAPAVEELFANGPHVATGTFEVGLSSLDVETANSIDLTLAQEEGLLKWNLNLFVNYIEDFIFLQGLDRNGDGVVDKVDEISNLGGQFTHVPYQKDNAVFYGFEAAASINIFSGDKGTLDLNLFGDFVHAERDNGDNLPRISPARIGTSLDYQYKKFAAGLDLTNILAQNNNGALETDTGGYSQVNLNANYDIIEGDQNLTVSLKATNLLNEDGELHTSFIKDRAPIMGRAVTVGLQASF